MLNEVFSNYCLMIIKLTFFKEVPYILDEFLRPIRTVNPMVSFLCRAYEDLLR